MKSPKSETRIYKLSDLPICIEDLIRHPSLTDSNCSKFLNFFKSHHSCFLDQVFFKSDWQTTYLEDWKKENNINDYLYQKEIDFLTSNFKENAKTLLDLVIKNK